MKENSNALPKLTDHYVQVKNSVFDAWRRFYLPGNTWKVYFAIYRKTVGYHWEWLKISREDFKEKTLLNDHEIKKALANLKQTNLIHKKGYSNNPNYKVNQYVTTWKTYLKAPQGCLCAKKGTPRQQKRVPQEKDSSSLMVLKKRKERKKPFSFSDLEKSKDKTERDFFELFKDYPERTDCKKALEIFRTEVDHLRGINKIKIALECYLEKKKKPKSIYHGLGVWMEKWIEYYDMGKHDAECREAAAVKLKEADIEAAVERKRIENEPAISSKVLDKIKRKNMPGTNWDARAKKKGG